ncbi:Exodeoxyribonuclease I subunit D [Clostridium sp. USBA 49]|uniref:exonuclease SbcCD subunit D n=1 Tax=Clostridium sp. USBA 49 TaxID=1881060 RepID=UPI000999DE92|nr:exonuclease SbcCD subunit D [Clostridium sp. USBA 49]SKA81538.1 Exodeoxyribonuclease I subunit D [Clostridium sp. USBA 49]
MKIIHTGDWHIGKIVNEFSMIEDQRFILEQLIKIIEEEKPQALVIAGDLYDRSIPPIEAVELLDEVFNKILLDLNVPILAIAGNHDSAERLSFGSRIFTNNGLHIAGIFDSNIKKVTFEDECGNVNFYLVPYSDPREIKAILKDDEISTHDDAMKKVIERIKEDIKEGEKNVLVAHGYVSFMKEYEESEDKTKKGGLEICDSERPLSIGGTDLISGEHFSCFNYTALGHLHCPQKVGSDKIRYSGSLLKYSFSEKDHKKGVTIVNIDEKGDVSVEQRPLKPKRDMRVIKGPLKELISKEVYESSNREDYIYAILTDEEDIIDPISKLRAVYPNIMGLHREDNRQREKSKTSAGIGYKNKSKLELFNEFYKDITHKELTKEKLDIVKEVIEAVEKEVK